MLTIFATVNPTQLTEMDFDPLKMDFICKTVIDADIVVDIVIKRYRQIILVWLVTYKMPFKNARKLTKI